MVLGEEEGFEVRPSSTESLRATVGGDSVRDYSISSEPRFWPYTTDLSYDASVERSQSRWPLRTTLRNSLWFGKTREELGRGWLEYGTIARSKIREPIQIAFAAIASHNHFTLDESSAIFKQSAPVLKLAADASVADYEALLGLLNSSTVGFWMTQLSKPKGGAAGRIWSRTYDFSASSVHTLPLPSNLPKHRGRLIADVARTSTNSVPGRRITPASTPTDAGLAVDRKVFVTARSHMIQLQEDLDWECYQLYGLIEADLTFPGAEGFGIELGQRAFEIVLARRIAAGEEESAWFSRHGSTPITELPAEWPEDYKDLVERRIGLIESHPFIKLLERPEYKRRWASEPWEKQEERALRDWLLDRLEDPSFWFDRQGRPTPRSVLQLADDVSRDSDLPGVLALWEGRPDIPVAQSLQRLLSDQAVPYLAAYRYKEPGLRKRAAWEATWALQRREDAGETLTDPIPVPPKYTSADFARTEYWSHRGKLDVPKERFILYPDAGRDTDPTPLLGWAGWDHAQQSLALATLIQQRESDGWADQRLVPLVAGLAEQLPWVRQWHHDPDPFYGGTSPADFFTEQLDQRARQVGATPQQLAGWKSQPTTRGRRKTTTT